MRNCNVPLESPDFITICLVLLCTTWLINAKATTYAQPSEEREQSFETPEEAANKAIESFLDSSYFGHITEKEASLLGYKSKDEIKIAKPGPPLHVWVVGLKQLRDFKSGVDPKTVLTN